MKKIAIFASGTGTNADQIMHYFESHPKINVSLIISDQRSAGVKQFALQHAVDFIYLPYSKIKDEVYILPLLEEYGIDYLVLAGFLRLIPGFLVKAYHNRILNIHPALLPKYGGKGMYGQSVHRKVKDNRDPETGITIHLVDEQYDEGKILFQKSIAVDKKDSIEEIAQKVHTLEHKYYPKVIHSWIIDQSAAS